MWRALFAATLAWLPTCVAVAGAAARWNAYIVLMLALGGWTLTFSLAAVVLEGKPRGASSGGEKR